MCSDINDRMGTSHIKVFLDVHTTVGALHMQMCSDVLTKVGTPQTYILGGGDTALTLLMGATIGVGTPHNIEKLN